MLKFIKHHMSGIDGIEIYPIISLLIFTAFFTGLLIWAFRANKDHITKMKNMPLNEE